MGKRVRDDEIPFRLSLTSVLTPWATRGGGVVDSSGDPPLLPKTVAGGLMLPGTWDRHDLIQMSIHGASLLGTGGSNAFPSQYDYSWEVTCRTGAR
jgi:hypothetical protein